MIYPPTDSHIYPAIFLLIRQIVPVKLLDYSVFTKEVARQMVWLSGLLPYEQCEAVFAEIGEQWLSASSIWRQTQEHGQRLLDYVEAYRDQVSVERIQFPDAKHDHDQRKGISMDGGMVNIRDEVGVR